MDGDVKPTPSNPAPRAGDRGSGHPRFGDRDGLRSLVLLLFLLATVACLLLVGKFGR
jgi:hypothetical protein